MNSNKKSILSQLILCKTGKAAFDGYNSEKRKRLGTKCYNNKEVYGNNCLLHVGTRNHFPSTTSKGGNFVSNHRKLINQTELIERKTPIVNLPWLVVAWMCRLSKSPFTLSTLLNFISLLVSFSLFLFKCWPF